MVKTNVNLCGVKLQNPVVPASGTFGFGYEFSDIYDINVLGAISIKGTTRDNRFGNPTPRIAECTSGLINSVGLQNPGIDAVIEKEIPRLRQVYSQPIISNISGFSIDEYVECCEKINAVDDVDIIEVNISCPNVHNGGMSFGTQPENAEAVTKAVKKVTTKPVFIKLTPNVTDIVSIAKACEQGGADGISLINTVQGLRINLNKRKPVIANKIGGFSGRAIFPIALRMVWQVYEAVKLPIMGIGGVATAEDVVEMMMAGATAVQVGAENLVNPYACRDIIDNLPAVMAKYKINDLSEIIGEAHKHPAAVAAQSAGRLVIQYICLVTQFFQQFCPLSLQLQIALAYIADLRAIRLYSPTGYRQFGQFAHGASQSSVKLTQTGLTEIEFLFQIVAASLQNFMTAEQTGIGPLKNTLFVHRPLPSLLFQKLL